MRLNSNFPSIKNKPFIGITVLLSSFIFVLLSCYISVHAMTPIPPEAMDELIADGRYDDWLEQVDKVKDYAISRDMSASNIVSSDANAYSAAPPQRPELGNRWMPTEGTANALVICVEFPDQLHYASQTTTAMNSMLLVIDVVSLNCLD